MFDASLLLDPLLSYRDRCGRNGWFPRFRVHFGCGAVGLLKLDGDCLCPVAVDGLAHETLAAVLLWHSIPFGRYFIQPFNRAI